MQEIKGKKLNMSQLFSKEGKVIPVTLIQAHELNMEEDIQDKSVKVEGVSKGKGFTGVMKRWNFKGGPATRGQSDRQRAPGSIGAQTPGRVFKGKKMAGRHGNKTVTISGLKIVKVEADKKLIYVSGAIPGPRNGAVTIKVL